jgi:hypothetical protein
MLGSGVWVMGKRNKRAAETVHVKFLRSLLACLKELVRSVMKNMYPGDMRNY